MATTTGAKPAFVLRWAEWQREGDIASICALVRELAEFEKELHSVKLTPDQMREDLKAGHFVCLLATKEGDAAEAVGMALCHTRYSTWDGLCMHLEDLYVKTECRGQGLGRLLIEACVKYTQLQGLRRLCWEVLDWNADAIAFYRGLGAELLETWRCVRLSGDSLAHFPFRNEQALSQLQL